MIVSRIQYLFVETLRALGAQLKREAKREPYNTLQEKQDQSKHKPYEGYTIFLPPC